MTIATRSPLYFPNGAELRAGATIVPPTWLIGQTDRYRLVAEMVYDLRPLAEAVHRLGNVSVQSVKVDAVQRLIHGFADGLEIDSIDCLRGLIEGSVKVARLEDWRLDARPSSDLFFPVLSPAFEACAIVRYLRYIGCPVDLLIVAHEVSPGCDDRDATSSRVQGEPRARAGAPWQRLSSHWRAAS